MSSLYPNAGGGIARPCPRCGNPLTPDQSQCPRCGLAQPSPQVSLPGQFLSPMGVQPPPSQPLGGAGSSANWNAPGQGGSAAGWSQTGGSSAGWGPGAQPGTGTNWANAGTNGSMPSGSPGTGASWPQNSLFAGQNPPMVPPSQPLQSSLFSPPNPTGTLGQPSTSLNGAFSPVQPSPAGPPLLFRPPTAGLSMPGQAQHGWATRGSGFQGPPNLNNQPDDLDEPDFPARHRPSRWVYVTIGVLLLILIGGSIFVASSILGVHTNVAQATPVVVALPSVTPLFQDSFQNNNAGWDLSKLDGASVSLANGKLILESDNHRIFPEIVPGKTFDDFRVDVDAVLTKGDPSNGYGIYLRAGSTQDTPLGTYYRFEVYGTGAFSVYKGTQDGNGNSQPSTIKTATSTAILQQQPNHLTILAKGQTITFQVNNTTVFTLTDNSYKSGQIALFVSNVENVNGGAQATFTHFVVFPDK